MTQCLECNTTFKATRHDARFCCTACRKGFNNRRATRGAMLYDLFMASRYDRTASAELGVDRKTVDRVAQMLRAMDKQEGRAQSWRGARDVMEENAAALNACRIV